MGQSCSSPLSPSGLPGDAPIHEQGLKVAVPPLPGCDLTYEHGLPLSHCSFAIAKQQTRSSAGGHPAGYKPSWRWKYTLLKELGKGASATVYEAEVANPGLLSSPNYSSGGSCSSSCCSVSKPTSLDVEGMRCEPTTACLGERRRRVALKVFKKRKSRSFGSEQVSLLRIGVHPNVLRLLESYEDCDGHDVLVLEHCDGSTVFDVYAMNRAQNRLIPKRLVVRLVRQLLFALEHIDACGVEHQDVKPENLLLYDVNLEEETAQLKLADFGWAAVCGSMVKLPPEGAGSLWYAAPELNPTVEAGGIPIRAGAPVPGRSDMWSVGVVVYALLVGHNPFSAAQSKGDMNEIESEVLRLAALGSFDTRSVRYAELEPSTKDFISSLLKVTPQARLSVSEALRHPFLSENLIGSLEVAPPRASAWNSLKTESTEFWSRLDAFQHLGWLAVARACSEPELTPEVVSTASRPSSFRPAGSPSGGKRFVLGVESAYLWQLAKDLAFLQSPTWLRTPAVWTEVLSLAFSYLDRDGDGLLSLQDLAGHLSMAAAFQLEKRDLDSQRAAKMWLQRWSSPSGAPANSAAQGLSHADFRRALFASSSGIPYTREVSNDDLGQAFSGFNVACGN